MTLDQNLQLTVITPITALANRLENLMSWLVRIEDKSIEVYLIHDISDVQTGPQLNELVKKLMNPKVHLIEGVYGSPGIARNQAIKLAKGEWVCFWDGDDLPIIDNVSELMDKKINESVDCIVASYIEADVKSNLKTHQKVGQDYEVSIGLNPGLWRFIFRKSSIYGTAFTNLRMAEDQLFLATYLNVKRQIQIYPDYIYTYFKNQEFSLTRSRSALNDIASASKVTLKILNDSSESNSFIIGIMFARQIATGIKRGNIKCKIHVIATMIKGVGFCKSNTRRFILRGIYTVLFKGN
jgi:glycosyltransferase involved in cell wall biosynthesis